MANQQAPRQWFRLASISRPAPQEPTPTPEPTPALPRTTTIRPAFRPVGGTSSVPSSPVSSGRASQPSSPSDRKPEATPTTASVPNSPVKTAPTAPKPASTSSLPSSPAKPVAASTSSVSSSPAKAVAASTSSVSSSPAKAVAASASVTTSPAKTVASTVSVPSAAKTAPTTTSVTSPPTQKPASFTTTTTTTRASSPKASIPTVKPVMQSPIQSPKIKAPTAPPPSPLSLPPAQLRPQAELQPKIPVEAEQKTVLVQKMVEKPRGPFAVPQKDVGSDSCHPSNHGPKESSKYGETKEKSNGKKLSSDSEDNGMRVITIAGENKGAFMELIRSSPHKNGFQGSPHRLQKKVTGSDGSDYHSYSSSGEEGDRKTKDKSNGSKSNTMPMNAYMNSNVQGVNNSIVYNSSYTHHDPGVHLSLHRKPTTGGFHVKERTNGYNS